MAAVARNGRAARAHAKLEQKSSGLFHDRLFLPLHISLSWLPLTREPKPCPSLTLKGRPPCVCSSQQAPGIGGKEHLFSAHQDTSTSPPSPHYLTSNIRTRPNSALRHDETTVGAESWFPDSLTNRSSRIVWQGRLPRTAGSSTAYPRNAAQCHSRRDNKPRPPL